MQKILTTILLTFTLTSYGQQKFKPFKLVVLKPDAVVIDKSLESDIDSIEFTQRHRFFTLEEQFDSILNCKNCDTFGNTEIKKGLANMKSFDGEMKHFKYYQLISFNSVFFYNAYFNETNPLSTIIESRTPKTDIHSLKKFADTSHADYIVFFSDIHSEMKDNLPVLKLTTSLYSTQDNKMILTKETEGDTKPFGSRWEWTCNNTLSRLLINGVKTSTAQVVSEISKRQSGQ